MLQKNRAYSTEYSAHRGLINQMAYKGYLRLQQAGVAIEYDDVVQEMSLIYCKAAERFDASKGFTFAAYLGQAIWHDFNKVAEKLIQDKCGEMTMKDHYDEFDAKRAEVSGTKYENTRRRSGINNGTISIEALSGEDSPDFHDILPGAEMTPEEHLMSSRSFTDAMKSLPATERVIIGTMLRQVVRPRKGASSTDKSLAAIMREMNLSRKESVLARERIGEAFGVNLKGTK